MYRTLIVFFIASVVLVCVRTAAAQEVHAVTDEGKHVLLQSDGTWKYTKAAPTSSSRYFNDAASHFAIVIPASSPWIASNEKLMEDAEFSFQTSDDKCYGVIITEKIPLTDDELVNYLRSHLDSTASIVSDVHTKVNWIPTRRVQFDASSDGLNFRYNFDVYTRDDWYVKILTWSFKNAAIKDPSLLTSLTPYLKINEQ